MADSIPSDPLDLDTDSLASLPSSSSSTLSAEDGLEDIDEDEDDAEREWKESLQQLELLLTMVIVPYLGRYFGRKCAYWGELLYFFCCLLFGGKECAFACFLLLGLRVGEQLHGILSAIQKVKRR